MPCIFLPTMLAASNNILCSRTGLCGRTSATERVRRRLDDQLNIPPSPYRSSRKDIISFLPDINAELEHRHANGNIHEGLKPSDRLLQTDGKRKRVSLNDYTRFRAEVRIGYYLEELDILSFGSLKLIQGQTDIVKTDVYSLGMTFYFMVLVKLRLVTPICTVTTIGGIYCMDVQPLHPLLCSLARLKVLLLLLFPSPQNTI